MKRRTTILTFIACLCLLSCWDEGCEQLGDGYVYFDEQKYIDGLISIPPTVISYSYDEDYIIATQEYSPQKLAYFGSRCSESVYPEGRNGLFYWVIIKKEQNIFGPLDEEGYRIIKERYHIPERLKNRIRRSTKNEDYSGYSTMAVIDSTFCTGLASYRGWGAQECRPNLYLIYTIDMNGSKKSFWVLKRDILYVRMNLPENVLDGWIPLEEIYKNGLWNKYYVETVSADKISSFFPFLTNTELKK